MRAIKPVVTLLFACLITIIASSQTSPVLSYLPADAKMIVKINPLSLALKIKWQELMKYKMFEDVMKDTTGAGKAFLENPQQTGIDIGQGLFLVSENKNNKKGEPVLYGVPKDTSLFAGMVKKISPGKQAIKIGNAKMIINKNTVVAWNREIFVLTGTDNKEKSTNETDPKAKAAAELTRVKQLTEKCKRLLTKQPVTFNNEYFTSLLKQGGDLLLWINNTLQTQPQLKNKSPEIFGMLDKNFMRSGNYTSAVVNFENGKVSMEMRRYVSSSLDSIYKAFPAKNINIELLKRLPGGQPIFVWSFNISPAMVKEIIAKSGSNKVLDSLKKKNINVEDIFSSLKGDAMVALVKIYEFGEDDSVTHAMNGMQLFLAGSINDAKKLKSSIASLQDSTKKIGKGKMKPFALSNDSFFVVSLSRIAGQKFLDSAGKNEEVQKLFYPYENYPAALIIDLRTVFNFLIQSVLKNKSEEDAKQATEVLSMFDKMISYGGRYDNGFVSNTIDLTLANKDENSLMQFIKLLNLFYSFKPKSPSE